MALDTTKFDADIASATTDMPASVTHSGTVYSCLVTEVRKGSDLELDGFALDHDLTVHARTSLFSTRPVVGEKVTIESVEYRIEEVITDPDDQLIKLNCKEV